MSEPRTVRFKASYWAFEETSDNDLIIHVSGLTENQETVQVKVEGFTPFIYIELPTRTKWNPKKCKKLFGYFQQIMGDEAPLKYKMFSKYKLHYLKKVNTLFLSFPTGKACRTFAWKFNKQLFIPGIGSYNAGEFQVHEHNIDPIIKFTASRKIHLAGWIEVTETIPEGEEDIIPEDRKFSEADIDMCVNFLDVNPVENPVSDNGEPIVVQPRYNSFDIECYSKNHNSKLPDPAVDKNVVFQIAMVFGRYNTQEKKKKILLSLFDPHDIEDTEVIRCASERDILLKFQKITLKENPDIFIGYNIMKFDWHYLLERAKKLKIEDKFLRLSRLLNVPAIKKQASWSSSAYGKQVFNFPDCHGRTNVDVLLEVERNFKFPTYSLNAVSEYFLKNKKDDITPKQLFMLYQITEEILPKVCEKPSMSMLNKIRKRIAEILEVRKCHGVVKSLRRKLLTCSPSKIRDTIREALTLTGKYCVQDTILPIDLCEKLNLWTTMEEMSNVMHVPVSYLHTRGQQIKVLAQIYRETLVNNIIIPYNTNKNSDEKFQGATVIDANPGDYNYVATLDFASLYPTTMIAFNICYTTILEDDDPTPDEECHVLEFESHRFCEHDTKKRKSKGNKKDMMCSKHRYRFRKVKIHYDEKTKKISREHEGLMPRLERNLLATRKEVKKEMFKLESKLKMHLGQATEEDIAFFRKCGFEIIEKGSLTKNQEVILTVMIGVLNAKQLAIKVSANSCYGALGAKNGFVPLLAGAASVTAMGRRLIDMAIKKILSEWDFCKLVYGDTDSCMIVFMGKTLQESFNLAEEASSVGTHHLKSWILGVDEKYTVSAGDKKFTLDKITSKSKEFRDLSYNDKIKVLEYEAIPIDLEFENMYGRFLLLSKKRYIAYVVNRKGEIIGVTKKGVVLARRDNCGFLRTTYKSLGDGILDNLPEEKVMSILYDRVEKLFTRQIPPEQFTIYIGVKDVIDYAKKKEFSLRGNKIECYVDDNGDAIDNVVGPLDPRLVYPNIPQCLLALKLLRRGTDVPANTRLEFLYLENPNAEHQGDKAEDFMYYKENRHIENLKIDYLHYLEKQLLKPVTELLAVKFPRNEIVLYEKLENALKRVLLSRNISEYKQNKISREKKRIRVINEYTPEDSTLIGWSALEKDGDVKISPSAKKKSGTSSMTIKPSLYKKFLDEYKSSFRVSERVSPGVYTYTGNEAKVMYILESAKKGGPNEFNSTDPVEKEIIDVCQRWKSRCVLDKTYKAYGMTKVQARRPKQHGDKLRENTEVVLLHNTKNQRKGVHARVIARRECKNIKNKFYFDLMVNDTDEIIENIPREAFTTYYYKDDQIIKDMLLARTRYRKVIETLNEFNNPALQFED